MTIEQASRDQMFQLPQSEGTIRLRLLTNELLDEVRIYLMGGYTFTEYDSNKKETVLKTVSIGEEKCNQRGLQSIMFFLKMHFSQHLVLGNITDNQYSEILMRTRSEFSKNLMINRINYNIKLSDYSEIMDYILQAYEIYLTRAIGAGDRKSLVASTSTVERVSETPNSPKRFGLF